MMNQNTSRSAQILTYAGLIPFALLSFAVVLELDSFDFDLALRSYGVAIISFLCGIHWGIYLLASDKCPRNLLLISNTITLVAYSSILFPFGNINYITQSFCLAILLELDYELLKKDVLPVWYFNLRRNASCIVILLLLMTACLI